MNKVYESDQITVTVLKEGYCTLEEDGSFHADGTITLVETSQCKVLVDTGGPWDRQYLINALTKAGVGVDDISHVIGTHGHSDHIGNLNLFPGATHIVGWDICHGDHYTSHSFSEGNPYEISSELVLMPTPGHTHNDVSLVVKDGPKVVVIAGDLFESEADLSDPSLWRDCSEDPPSQEKNRTLVLKMADIIVPGHGPPFHVKESHRHSKSDL
ncbi:metallo-beta-lactamase domain-containing protein 1-like [Diadema antillarum]|uniref:metallo-beta-lactamase domain-containing protein 1-like n=1 Tax=Diadema antillarum TaxID=105358 RepID=UPI003A898E2F